MKAQFDTRINRGFKYPATAIGMEYRSNTTKKLKKGQPAGREEVQYLQDLVEKMIAYDHAVGQVEVAPVLNLARSLHAISAAHTTALSSDLKKGMLDKLAAASAPVDGGILVHLLGKYKGRLFYDYERDKKTFRVEDIKFVSNKTNANWPCWEATCVEVAMGEGGEWCVPSHHLVKDTAGLTAIKKKSYEGFGLVELIGEAEIPSPMPWVDLYIARHEANLAAGLYKRT